MLSEYKEEQSIVYNTFFYAIYQPVFYIYYEIVTPQMKVPWLMQVLPMMQVPRTVPVLQTAQVLPYPPVPVPSKKALPQMPGAPDPYPP